ncbi:MAG: KpsF/GutQ family sugar-phosphate isomerase [Desulfovibrio sp.]|uniref:KpsF/GutQ family sugar-phosphate isomerase n=1 Tax=Desulfovibrio sp. 7SRBS1 TaxID=3378064 RepID=UPI003B3DF288
MTKTTPTQGQTPSATSWIERGRQVLNIEIEELQRVRDSLDDSFPLAVETLAACTGRVIVSGIGKSGLVGRKIAATLSSTGTPAYFLHPVEGAHGDLGMIRQGDVVLALSNSGETDELNAILPSLRSLGACIISITGNTASTMAKLSDITVTAHVQREACPHNLAPTASTTAALAVGDALAVCLIEKKQFTESDFKLCHPGGALGQRLSQEVGGLMHTDNLPVIASDTSLRESLAAMNAGGLGFLAVTAANGALSGILTDGDVRRLLSSGTPDLDAQVQTCMRTVFLTASPSHRAAQVLDTMEEKQVTVLPIVEDGRLVGMIHLHDLLGKGKFKFSA